MNGSTLFFEKKIHRPHPSLPSLLLHSVTETLSGCSVLIGSTIGSFRLRPFLCLFFFSDDYRRRSNWGNGVPGPSQRALFVDGLNLGGGQQVKQPVVIFSQLVNNSQGRSAEVSILRRRKRKKGRRQKGRKRDGKAFPLSIVNKSQPEAATGRAR